MNFSYGPHIVALFSLCELPFIIQKSKLHVLYWKKCVNTVTPLKLPPSDFLKHPPPPILHRSCFQKFFLLKKSITKLKELKISSKKQIP